MSDQYGTPVQRLVADAYLHECRTIGTRPLTSDERRILEVRDDAQAFSIELSAARHVAVLAVLDAKHAHHMHAMWLDFRVVMTVCGATIVVSLCNGLWWDSKAVSMTCASINILMGLRAIFQRITAKARSRRLYGTDKQ